MPTSLIPNWPRPKPRTSRRNSRSWLCTAPRAKKHFANLQDYDLLLTTYAFLPKDIEQLTAQPLHVLILDEAQYIKNPSSKAAQAARELKRTAAPVPERARRWKTTWASCGRCSTSCCRAGLGDIKSFNRDYRVPIEKTRQ